VNGPRITESEFQSHLLSSGRISSRRIAADPASRPVFPPITLDAEPLSETIQGDIAYLHSVRHSAGGPNQP
jgi:hypothetical protein